MELPLAPSAAPERADAARNRERILCAAQRLWAERGVSCTSMDAIAAEAGVGKGTLFRRFGDRSSLALAVLDVRERALQDAVLTGPPPLGPGAPPVERLAAFGSAVLAFTAEQLDLVLEAEVHSGGRWMRSAPQAVRRLHLQVLVSAARPDCDVEYATDVLADALSAQLLAHQLREREMPLERLQAGYADLVERLLG
ncbi:MAG: TetR/AcrR family transcriptional regulator [Solirubrobacterales bacterium]|nr:TetR/AcrR family transcriptional regulator [Solirubrobacterales bacterium]